MVVIRVMRREKDILILAPYHLRMKKFLGPLRLVYLKGDVTSQLEEALSAYVAVTEYQVVGVTDEINSLCEQNTLVLPGDWKIYHGPLPK